MQDANVRTDDSWGHGNTKMNSLKTALNGVNYLFDGQTVDNLEMYLWALTASYSKPATQVFAWAPKKIGTLEIPRFPTYAPVARTASHNQKTEVNFKIGLLCWDDNATLTADPHDMEEFSSGTLGVTNRAYLETALQAMLGGLGQHTASDGLDVIDVHNWHPEGYAINQMEHYNPLWYNKSISVEVRMQNYNNTVEGLNAIMSYLNRSDFSELLAAHLDDIPVYSQPSLKFNRNCIVPPKDVTDGISHSVITWTPPTRSPTRATERAAISHVLPGARVNCQKGVNIELRGRVKFYSTEDLEADLNRADTVVEKIYDDMAEHTMTLLTGITTNPLNGTTLSGCHIISQTWKSVTHNVTKDNDGLTHPDECNEANEGNCKTHEYTIDFTMAIPTSNMHEGNKIFHDYEFLESVQTRAINVLLYAPDPLPTDYDALFNESASPNLNEYRPFKPLVSEIKVFSLELAYIRETVTPAPTPRPTRSAINCEISKWSTWTSCSKSCGTGTRSQYRIVETENQGNGTSCSDALAALHASESNNYNWTKSENCATDDCPINCVMQGWESWSPCETNSVNHQGQSCGSGTHKRVNLIVTHPVNGAGKNGTSCKVVAATTHPTQWFGWNLQCNSTHCFEDKECSDQTCPIDCTVTSWTNWTDCSKECGTGQKTRYRAIDTPAYYGGVMGDCANLTQQQDCNVNYCPQDCVVSEWSAWGSCDKSCGNQPIGTRLFGAKQIRTRYVLTPAESGGHKCPSLTQSKLCALHPCGAQVCKSDNADEFPLTCTYENGIVYTHHVNDVHKDDLFMCYHNYVTEVCTCLCWPKSSISTGANGGVHACGVNNTCVEV